MTDPEASKFAPLPRRPEEEVMATRAGQVLWSHRPGFQDGAIDIAALPLPVLKEDGYLREVFNGLCFMGLLPLIHFLQRITRDRRLEAPPLQACFVFDDPNLRAGSYGCINFRELAEHARTWHYHTAIGLIPLDALWASSGAVALFREASQHLSLVVHGSRHLYHEMACDCSEAVRLAVIAQALRRVQTFERRHGLRFCRVMESPHAALTADMFKPLLALGYEAAMVTPLKFLESNRKPSLPAAIGCEVAGCLPGGLGLIPRIKMSPWWKTEALQAALLGQPIVIVGHHYDADNGFALLEDIVTTVNRLGAVRWCRLGDISRSNYASRVEQRMMKVWMGSRRLHIPIPDGVEEIQVERPWLTNGELGSLTLSVSETGVQLNQVCTRISAPMKVAGARAVEIFSPAPEPINPEEVPSPRPQIWPVVRRILTEARDRAYPYLPKPVARRLTRPDSDARLHR